MCTHLSFTFPPFLLHCKQSAGANKHVIFSHYCKKIVCSEGFGVNNSNPASLRLIAVLYNCQVTGIRLVIFLRLFFSGKRGFANGIYISQAKDFEAICIQFPARYTPSPKLSKTRHPFWKCNIYATVKWLQVNGFSCSNKRVVVQ